MYNIIKRLIFTVLIVVMSTSLIYADRVDTGWKGYGLYNLSKSEVSILDEEDAVTINGGNVAAVYKYTIKNNSAKNITVNFGYPDNGIYKFSVNDGSKFLSYKTRDNTYLKDNYKVEGLQTPEVRWYLFNMVFEPGQTRVIKVSIDSEMKKAENDIYGLSFFKDRNYSYAIASEKTKLTLKFANFKPYSIFELEGIKPEDISKQGEATLSYSENYGDGASVKYQPIDKMAIDRLNASEYKKPKAIVKAFNAKNYKEALTLSNDYINAPSDNRLSLEQVKYVNAECNRLLNNNQEYINSIEQLDIAKLYPERIKYKVLLDKLSVYDALNNDEAIDNILAELLPEQKNYPYLNYWLNQNGYKLSEGGTKEAEAAAFTGNVGKPTSDKGFDILGTAIKVITTLKESKWTFAILGLIVGFIIGRLSKRSRKRSSTYLFRN